MERHYEEARALGVVGARDGLSWRHSIFDRVRAVPQGFPVMWDMVHFDMPPEPEDHAVACAHAIGEGGWAIAVNEPTAHGMFHGEGSWRYVETAIRMMQAAPTLNYACCDPLHGLEAEQWWATDRLVESGMIHLVGINYYPIHSNVLLREIIREARRRYPGIDLAITETSWHVDHPRLPGGDRRAEWIDEVRRECDEAGGVRFICWYPWLDMPDWDNPDAPRWPSGWYQK